MALTVFAVKSRPIRSGESTIFPEKSASLSNFVRLVVYPLPAPIV